MSPPSRNNTWVQDQSEIVPLCVAEEGYDTSRAAVSSIMTALKSWICVSSASSIPASLSESSSLCGSSVRPQGRGKMLNPPAEFVGAMGQLAKATGQDELQVCPRLSAETPVRVLGISI